MLENHKKQPRDSNWQDIESKLNDDRIQSEIKSKFDHFSITPSMENWDKIDQKIGTTPSKNNYKKTWSIAAAITILLFASTYSYITNKQVRFSEFFIAMDSDTPLPYELCMDPAIVTLDIVKPVVRKHKKTKRRKLATTKQKRLLDVILEIDDNIESQVDSALIAELLKPADILSDASMFADLDDSNSYYYQGVDFKYMYALPKIDYHLTMPSDTQSVIIFKGLLNSNRP